MGLLDEWNAMRDAVELVATDLTRLTIVTEQSVDGQAIATVTSVVELDGDSSIFICGDSKSIAPCHRSAVGFTYDLASMRLQMIARVGKALIS